MQIGIFAKTFAGTDPATVLTAAAATGFDGVQYNMACSGLDAMPDAIAPEAVEAIASAARQTGQQIFALSGTYNMAHPDPAVRATGQRRLEVLARACKGMGTGLITLCTGSRDAEDQWRHHPDNATPEAWRDMLASFEVAVGIAEAHDIRLGVEPELANVVSSARSARRLIDELQSRHIGIVLDPANLFVQTSPPAQRALVAEAVGLLAGHIVMTHAKDRDPSGGFATAGKGMIDFDHFVRTLQSAGFAGPLVTHGLSADEAADVAAFLREKLRATAP
jgi:sugar phosphate isomerase/epimerase